jgi:DNA-binding beta-propeller fold protein YncE
MPFEVAASATATAVSGQPACTTATQPAPRLPAAATTMLNLRSSRASSGLVAPFGVAVTSDGRWAFAALGQSVAVLKLSTGRAPSLVRTIDVFEEALGVTLTPDGRYLLIAGGAGAVVVNVQAAEQGSAPAVLGQLSAPGRPGSAIEVAVSRDSQYAFVSLEYADRIAVFDLAKAVADGFGSAGRSLGAVPAGVSVVGLAVSPDGRWLYATSEGENRSTEVGMLEVISVPAAESDPAHSIVGTVQAGCNPVRVITSADGTVVWVTARASDALLAFSAARLRTDPAHSLLADVEVGEAPVGLALARAGGLIVVADSNRFNAASQGASLAIVSVPAALAGRPALVGYLPAGQFPRDMAASPDGDAVLVANYLSGQLETVNITALP